MYKSTQTIVDETTGKTLGGNAVERLIDGLIIPFDLANTDYQEYLKWVAKGNTPKPAQEN